MWSRNWGQLNGSGRCYIAQSYLVHGLEHGSDIWFVANGGRRIVTCAACAVVDRFGADARYVIVEGGLFGQLSHQGIGVRRYRIDVSAPGGHSWGNFGAASAIHSLAHL
ncbi:MAG: hypothetical protein R3C44_04920 [Chloroflexota bacterium]